ncbi:MAG: hypothetical protein KKI20_01015 [Gammaproteobacteria bacterium]|nr:hypothetical protein [Gammaproteobacteria bacterium]
MARKKEELIAVLPASDSTVAPFQTEMNKWFPDAAEGCRLFKECFNVGDEKVQSELPSIAYTARLVKLLKKSFKDPEELQLPLDAIAPFILQIVAVTLLEDVSQRVRGELRNALTLLSVISNLQNSHNSLIANYIHLAHVSQGKRNKRTEQRVFDWYENIVGSSHTDVIRQFPNHLSRQDYTAIYEAFVAAEDDSNIAAYRVLQLIDATSVRNSDLSVAEIDASAFEYARELLPTIHFAQLSQKEVPLSREFLMTVLLHSGRSLFLAIAQGVFSNETLFGQLKIEDLQTLYSRLDLRDLFIKALASMPPERFKTRAMKSVLQGWYQSAIDDQNVPLYFLFCTHLRSALRDTEIVVLDNLSEAWIVSSDQFQEQAQSFVSQLTANESLVFLTQLFSRDFTARISQDRLNFCIDIFLRRAIGISPFLIEGSSEEERRRYVETFSPSVRAIVSTEEGRRALKYFFSEYATSSSTIMTLLKPQDLRAIFEAYRFHGLTTELAAFQLMLFENPNFDVTVFFSPEERLGIATKCFEAAQREMDESVAGRYEKLVLSLVLGIDLSQIDANALANFVKNWLARDPSVSSLVVFLGQLDNHRDRFSAVYEEIAVYVVENVDPESSESEAFLNAMVPDRLDLVAKILRAPFVSTAVREAVVEHFLNVFLGREIGRTFEGVARPRNLSVGDVEGAGSFDISELFSKVGTVVAAESLLQALSLSSGTEAEEKEEEAQERACMLHRVLPKEVLEASASPRGIEAILEQNRKFLIMVLLWDVGRLRELLAMKEGGGEKKKQFADQMTSESRRLLDRLLAELDRDFLFVLADHWLSQKETQSEPAMQAFVRDLVNRLQPTGRHDQSFLDKLKKKVSEFVVDIGLVTPKEPTPAANIAKHADEFQLGAIDATYKGREKELAKKMAEAPQYDRVAAAQQAVEQALAAKTESFPETVISIMLSDLTYVDFHSFLERRDQWDLNHLARFIRLFLTVKGDSFYEHLKQEDAPVVMRMMLLGEDPLNFELIVQVVSRLSKDELETLFTDPTIPTDRQRKLLELLLSADKLSKSTRYFLLQWMATEGVVYSDQIPEGRTPDDAAALHEEALSLRLQRLREMAAGVCKQLPEFIFYCAYVEAQEPSNSSEKSVVSPAPRYSSLMEKIEKSSGLLGADLSKRFPVGGEFPQPVGEKVGSLDALEEALSDLSKLVSDVSEIEGPITGYPTPSSFCESPIAGVNPLGDSTVRRSKELSVYVAQTQAFFNGMFKDARQKELAEIITAYFEQLGADAERAHAFLETALKAPKFFDELNGGKRFSDTLSNMKNRPGKGWSSADLFGIAVLKLLERSDADRALLLSVFSTMKNPAFKEMLVRCVVKWMKYSQNTDPFLTDPNFVSFLLTDHYKKWPIKSWKNYALFLRVLQSAGNLKPHVDLVEVVKSAKFEGVFENKEMHMRTLLWMLYHTKEYRITEQELAEIVKYMKSHPKKLETVLGQDACWMSVLYDVFLLRSPQQDSLNDSYFLGSLIANGAVKFKKLMEWVNNASGKEMSRRFFMMTGLTNPSAYDRVLKKVPNVADIPNLHLDADQRRIVDEKIVLFLFPEKKRNKLEQRWKNERRKPAETRQDIKDSELRKLQRRVRRRNRALLEEVARREGMPAAIELFLKGFYFPWFKDEDMGVAVGTMPLEASVFLSWMRRANRYVRNNEYGFGYEDVCSEGEGLLRGFGGLFLGLRSGFSSFLADRRIRKNPYKEELPLYDETRIFSSKERKGFKRVLFIGEVLTLSEKFSQKDMLFQMGEVCSVNAVPILFDEIGQEAQSQPQSKKLKKFTLFSFVWGTAKSVLGNASTTSSYYSRCSKP